MSVNLSLIYTSTLYAADMVFAPFLLNLRF
jgi:hypothetical protein